jgi:hypothetical protein
LKTNKSTFDKTFSEARAKSLLSTKQEQNRFFHEVMKKGKRKAEQKR